MFELRATADKVRSLKCKHWCCHCTVCALVRDLARTSRTSPLTFTSQGLGLFATTFIERGTLVISEEPLLKIPGHEAYLVWGPYSRLGNAEKAAYDSLHSFEADYLNFDQASRTRLVDYTDDNLDEEDIDEMVTDHCRVMAIFATNNFLIPPSELGIFVTASRLNHSCVPNVHHSYNPTLKSATVYAIRDIEPNEELLTSYIVCEDTYLVCT